MLKEFFGYPVLVAAVTLVLLIIATKVTNALLGRIDNITRKLFEGKKRVLGGLTMALFALTLIAGSIGSVALIVVIALGLRCV